MKAKGFVDQVGVRTVVIVLGLLLSSCGEKPSIETGTRANVPDSENAALLRSLIEQSGDTLTRKSLLPPATHNGFWLSGNTASLGTVENRIPGFMFARWETGMDPVQGVVSAFQGWIFLRPKGGAQVVYQKFLYRTTLRHNMAEAFAVKYPKNYEQENRVFVGTWEIAGSDLTVSITDKDGNPDSQYFSGKSNSRKFDLGKWEPPAEVVAQKTAEKAAALKAANTHLVDGIEATLLRSMRWDEVLAADFKIKNHNTKYAQFTHLNFKAFNSQGGELKLRAGQDDMSMLVEGASGFRRIEWELSGSPPFRVEFSLPANHSRAMVWKVQEMPTLGRVSLD